MIKRLLPLLSVFALSLLLTGCPSGMKYPIDQPSIKINHKYMGRYEGEFPESYFSENRTIQVSKDSEFTYKLVMESADKEKKSKQDKEEPTEPEEYIAHFSEISGRLFINVRTSMDLYYLYSVTEKGHAFVLTELSDVLSVKSSNSTELKNLIARHLNNELMYGEQITVRKK